MTTEVQWSELQRDPKSVAALADKGDVRVRRRDGAPLLLTREDRTRATAEGSVIAARALRNLVAHVPAEMVAAALVDEFPWADLLPEDEQAEFARDLARAILAAAELGQWSIIKERIVGWRSTAFIYGDPDLLAKLTGPFDGDFGPVQPPMEA